MYVSMYVCMYVEFPPSISLQSFVDIFACMHEYAYMCVYGLYTSNPHSKIFVRMFLCVFIHTYAYIHTYACIYVCIYLCVCVVSMVNACPKTSLKYACTYVD